LTDDESTTTGQEWNRRLAPYARAQDGRAWFQLLSTTALFALNWYLMLRSLAGPYWVTLLLALPAAGFSIRMFIFQHDCGHGSFFQSMRLNHAVGRVLGVLTLMPYWYWRRTHAIHHATSGDLDHRSFGDVEVWTVDEYLGKSRWGRLGYRLYRNPFILIGLGPAYQFLLKHRFPYDIPRAWKREWLSVMGTNLALAAIVVVAWQTIGLAALLKVQLPITLVSGSLGIWLFYIQHQFEDTYWRENPEWEFHRAGIEGSSYYDLPRVLHWFTGNIGYHHIHHLASRIPNYRLAECFREVPELAHVTRLTILGSLRCARLHLWDEQGRRLVSFRQLRRLAQSSASA
jgi:omega-6 fatty acid desaturase (delta-12 desaturase)